MMKLAAYLDEGGDAIDAAARNLASLYIRNTVIRKIDLAVSPTATDAQVARLRDIVVGADLNTLAVQFSWTAANLETKEFNKHIDRCASIASYFHTGFMSFDFATDKKAKELAISSEQAKRITEVCVSHNMVPLIAPGDCAAATIAEFLVTHKRWRLHFDPASHIIKRKQDVYVKYWSLLKKWVALIDVRDYKIGFGFKPVPLGDVQWARLLPDCKDCWMVMEPSLGQRYGSHAGRDSVFAMAYQSFSDLVRKC
jgi:hypothetical protein